MTFGNNGRGNFAIIPSKNLQNWKSAKLNHLPYRIIL